MDSIIDLPAELEGIASRIEPVSFALPFDLRTNRRYRILKSVPLDAAKVAGMWSILRCHTLPCFNKGVHQPPLAMQFLADGHEKGIATIDWTLGNTLVFWGERRSGFFFDHENPEVLDIRREIEDRIDNSTRRL